jgi:hypothetical protein
MYICFKKGKSMYTYDVTEKMSNNNVVEKSHVVLAIKSSINQFRCQGTHITSHDNTYQQQCRKNASKGGRYPRMRSGKATKKK